MTRFVCLTRDGKPVAVQTSHTVDELECGFPADDVARMRRAKTGDVLRLVSHTAQNPGVVYTFEVRS